MGNCSLRAPVAVDCPNAIRVLTDSGGVLQFKGPKPVKHILCEYPGYGIFLQGHASASTSAPLSDCEYLVGGQCYCLLPLQEMQVQKLDVEMVNGIESPKSSSFSSAAMDFVDDLANGPALQVLPSQRNGVWRVKLVIDTKQLEEILSEQVNTEALIEKMRMAATTAAGAAAAVDTPRKSKSSWGVVRKQVMSSVFKVPN